MFWARRESKLQLLLKFWLVREIIARYKNMISSCFYLQVHETVFTAFGIKKKGVLKNLLPLQMGS